MFDLKQSRSKIVKKYLLSVFVVVTFVNFAWMPSVFAKPYTPILAKEKSPRVDPKTKKEIPLTKAEQAANALSKQEKLAIAAIEKKNFTDALKIYRSLSKAYNEQKISALMDARILDLSRLEFEKTGIAIRFQKSLVELIEKYSNDQMFGPQNVKIPQKLRSTAQSEHRKLVDRMIKIGQAQKTKPEDRKTAIKVIDTYIGVYEKKLEHELLTASKGEIQYLSNDYQGSSNTFQGLAAENSSKAGQYWRLAIRSQRIVASWPVDPPWNGTKSGQVEAREGLRAMYQSLNRPIDWDVASHLGLLDIQLGRQEAAFTLFTNLVESNPKGVNAQQAVGLMATSYMNDKSWQKLEDLARLMIKKNIIGLRIKSTMRGRDLLGQALLEGGLEKHRAQDYKSAVTKLKEFVEGWRDHKRHDEGFYMLADSHYLAANYRTALETMISFVKTYRVTKYRQPALVSGGQWARSLAWDDHIMFFLEAHLKEFPKAESALVSQDILANLYIGKEHYDSATRIMEIQLADKRRSREQKYDIARQLLDMHEKNGSQQSAARVADGMLKDFGSSPEIAATAYSLKARLVSKDSPQKIIAIAKQLGSLDSSNRVVGEAQSEASFLIAESMALGTFDQEIFNLASRNPLADLNASYTKYEIVRGYYEGACSHAGSSWCGPAMHRLARVSFQYSKMIAPLDIPRTLAQSDVNAFLSRKKSIINTADQRSIAADERSLVEAKAGATHPDWTAAILWQNSTEWNSERVSGETGNGFIQWHVGK